MAADSNPTEVLAQVIELAKKLPSDPAEYAELPPNKRRALRAALRHLVGKLSSISEALDSVRQPKHVFDPTSPKIIGKIVADTLLLQREPLATVSKQPFYGAGVYAIYYRGNFAAYKPISGVDHPIYVGKADPAEMHAATAAAQGARLTRDSKIMSGAFPMLQTSTLPTLTAGIWSSAAHGLRLRNIC